MLKPHIAGAAVAGVLGSARALPVLRVGGTACHGRAGVLDGGRRGAPALAGSVGGVDGIGVVGCGPSDGGRVGVEDVGWC
ncbi:hypothetical protein BBD39_09200 [Arsenophonus endosymbiont of Bemisia tabaci Asia II 3]|nr:hypothetical protein BBD39_09200 [Arsenophonus endosymbiont of Bemisia tabaci Asia II 3]